MRGLYYQMPAHSCKEIRDLDVSKEDGEYWIDPEKNGKPLRVYCDMTTDGGKSGGTLRNGSCKLPRVCICFASLVARNISQCL